MKVAICYRGHYIRTARKKKHDFFSCYENHVKYLYSAFDSYDIFFNTHYVSDEDDKKLIEMLKPKEYSITKGQSNKLTSSHIKRSMKETSKLLDETEYDFIINLRFDLVFLKPFSTWDVQYDKFNFLFKDFKISWNMYKKTSDHMFCFPSKFLKIFVDKLKIKQKKPGCHLLWDLITQELSTENCHFVIPGYYSSNTDNKKNGQNGFVTLYRSAENIP
tara:strand:+ start:117 stop:770 length:654 start_codon:yes stop_codon:yes gene_type:complete